VPDANDGSRVRVAEKILKAIEVVRMSGQTNMGDWRAVSNLCESDGEDEAATWIRENPARYFRGFLNGFDAE
jgi:hypothetical protein